MGLLGPFAAPSTVAVLILVLFSNRVVAPTLPE